MPLILGTNSIKETGYNVANSLRFNDGSSDSLTKSFSGSGNRRTWTLSVWFKLGLIPPASRLFSIGNDASSDILSAFFTSGDLRFENDESGSKTFEFRTDQVFRDPSAWSHLVFAVDTTQSTSSNRVKIYHNGSQITSFSTENYPSQNSDTLWNHTTGSATIGARAASSSGTFFDGYMAEIVSIDGQQLDPTSFGEFDSDSPTIWKPKDVSGLTFGTNGFHLDFENASSLGADVSGNSHNFTVNNLTSVDQSTDTCTNNFMTLSPLLKGSNIDITEAGVVSTGNTSSDAGNVACTFPIAFSGKWYFEVKITAISAAGYPKIAVFQDFENVSQGNFNGGSGGNNMHPTSSIATVLQFTSTTLGSPDGNISITAPANGNIFQFALDMDNGAIYVGVNGTYYNSGDPTSGSSKTGKIADLTVTNQMMPMSSNYNGSATAYNFGGTPGFSISSGNADANGHGNFEYAPPTGYFALCSKNIGEFG